MQWDCSGKPLIWHEPAAQWRGRVVAGGQTAQIDRQIVSATDLAPFGTTHFPIPFLVALDGTETRFIVMTAFGTVRSAIDAIRLGAADASKNAVMIPAQPTRLAAKKQVAHA